MRILEFGFSTEKEEVIENENSQKNTIKDSENTEAVLIFKKFMK